MKAITMASICLLETGLNSELLYDDSMRKEEPEPEASRRKLSECYSATYSQNS